MIVIGTGDGADVRVEGGEIAAVGPDLDRTGAGPVLDAGGGRVIPGLHDHHVHLRALAARRSSVVVGPPEVTDAAGFAAAIRSAPAGPEGWVRAVGYHESVAGDLDAAALDAMVADRPVRVQHRSGALWVLNSAAVRLTGADASGRLFRMDDWLRSVVPPVELDVAAVGRDAAALGVTGFTDADPERTADDLAFLARLPQRVHVMGPLGLRVEGFERLTLGPVKVLLDDDTLPVPDELAATVAAAHAEGRPVAVHCVTHAQLVVALAAGLGAGDRIEHGALVAAPLIETLARRGVTVVTNPGFVVERGDRYAVEVDERDLPDLYRCRSLLDAGVAVAAGTDAPFGSPDPWAAVAAAAARHLGPAERVDPDTALGLFLGRADAPAVGRTIAPGQPADLCVLDADGAVAATVIGGEVVFSR